MTDTLKRTEGVIRDSADDSYVPQLVTGGQCLTKTLAGMTVPDAAKAAITMQAEGLLEAIVRAYDEEYGRGEVGEGGTAIATARSGVHDWGPTGLLYGRIQSGKTAAMITATALAIDNGFRLIVVLTTNFVELVKQTAERFTAVSRALVHTSTERDAWESDVANIKKHLGDRGLVLVCAKDPRHLESVEGFLSSIGAGNFPAIILDDEADQASLDNNARKRSMARVAKEEARGTKSPKRDVQDPDDIAPTKIHDLIARLRGVLRHHVFLQVTATPFALLLQNVDSPLRPRFTHLLEPGDGYTGGEHFFSRKHLGEGDDEDNLADPLPPLVYVDEEESDELGKDLETPPRGLEKAISFFLVSAAVQKLREPEAARQSQNFLCHTSHKMSEHKKLDTLIKRFLSTFEDQLGEGKGGAVLLVDVGYAELARTMPDLPPKADVIEDILDRLPRRRIRIVNSDGNAQAEGPGAPNFIVGGNIVGRGLTIPNLLVTYYLRKPKISQMDTMLQHARMFGYREKLMPLTRVFLPRSLAMRFYALHEAERELRKLVPDIDALSQIPVQVVGDLRPTRYGVLDTGSVQVFGSGKHVFPSEPYYDMPAAKTKEIEAALEHMFGAPVAILSASKSVPSRTVSVAEAEALIRLFTGGDWAGEMIANLVSAISKESNQCDVVFRTMNRRRREGQSAHLPTGALSGDELESARSKDRPTLFVMKQMQEWGVWDHKRFLYPSLVFPESMRAVVFNDTSE